MSSGCAGSICTGWKPVYARAGDTFTDKTAGEIYGNNEYGARLGCPQFRPRRR